MRFLLLSTLALALWLTDSFAAADAKLPQFVDVAKQAGLAFRHVNGASPDKHLVETMGSGAVLFDYDNDGWLDALLVDGGSLADATTAARARHRLFRNVGKGSYQDVTERSGIRHREYGMGACAGDIDGDERVDLYIANLGPNVMYRNRGDGTFVDITRTARVGDSKWSVGCAFGDLDADGDLDLWVVNYVEASRSINPICTDSSRKTRFYCHPLQYDPVPSTLYRNDGGGVFTDVTTQSGVNAHLGNGMGVVIADVNEDGRPDVFVTNDSLPNFLFRNEGRMRFTEVALPSGVAVATDGNARAGMGVDTSDYDSDGRLDFVITNLDFQMHTLHRGLGAGMFANATIESGIGHPTLPFVGFGVAFLDFDNDQQLDIAIVNGHVLDNAPLFRAGSVYAQRKLLFRGTTPRRFTEIGRSAGPGFAPESVGRGLATGDIDNDGDVDLLVTNNGRDAQLLRNDGGNRSNSLLLRLIGPPANRGAIGARVRVTTGSRVQLRQVKAGSSYASQNDLRVHVGLGSLTAADQIEVQWPDGKVQKFAGIAANQLVTVSHADGVTLRSALAR
jgi:hypothetical protein